MEKTDRTIVKKRSVLDVIRAVTASKNNDLPFFVADLPDVVDKYKTWKNKLPRVEPFYAVKCNPDPLVLRMMVSLGIGFDCASKWEIDTVISAGCKPSSIIYAHPYKIRDYIRHAAEKGVDLMTFDSVIELQKIKGTHPNARLVIRFRVPNVKAGFPLNDKFGCQLRECHYLLKSAKLLGLNVVGTSFHVGGLCQEPEAYFRAIAMAREVFDIAHELDFKFTILDMGGGFPGHTGSYELFNKMCQQINKGIDQYFSDNDSVRIIAEPGCYFVCSAFTLCTTIIGKKEVNNSDSNGSEDEDMKMVYYLNDGTYTSFSEGIEKYHFRVGPLFNSGIARRRPLLPSKLWGWSCCSHDCIMECCMLPLMDIDDHIVFENMGAYTSSISSNFNGLPRPSVMYMYSIKKGPELKIPPEIVYHQPEASYEKLTLAETMGFLCDDDSNSDVCRNG